MKSRYTKSMNKKGWVIAAVIVIAAIVLIAIYWHSGNTNPPAAQAPAATFDPLNATYVIDNTPVTLVDGRSSVPAAPGSATQIVTTIFGSPVSGDLTHDGVPDAAVMLAVDGGGSGTFYYIAAAVNASGTAQGTDAYLLGDRIAPQTLEIRNGQIIANYAVRKPGEPMTAQPSMGVSTYLIVQGSSLVPSNPPSATPAVRM